MCRHHSLKTYVGIKQRKGVNTTVRNSTACIIRNVSATFIHRHHIKNRVINGMCCLSCLSSQYCQLEESSSKAVSRHKTIVEQTTFLRCLCIKPSGFFVPSVLVFLTIDLKTILFKSMLLRAKNIPQFSTDLHPGISVLKNPSIYPQTSVAQAHLFNGFSFTRKCINI